MYWCNKHIVNWSGLENSSHINLCLCALFLGEKMNWMDIALKEAEKAFRKKEIPVGCVIVKDNKMISKSYNKREKNNNVLNHAEVDAILKANKKLKTWKLDDSLMFVTLKPCSMCEEIIKQSRIKKVIYLIERLENKKEYNKTIFEMSFDLDLQDKYKKMFSAFFVNKRKK